MVVVSKGPTNMPIANITIASEKNRIVSFAIAWIKKMIRQQYYQ